MIHSRPRISRHHSTLWAAPVVALLITCALVGCTPFATVIWVLKDGKTAAPEYSGLKNKLVAVVCRIGPGHEFKHLEAEMPQQIAERINRNLKSELNGKVRLITQQTIEQYNDENSWQDFTEVGRDLDVQRVVAIDIETLSVKNSGTMHQANLVFTVTVYDMEDDGEICFDKDFEITFPTEGGAAPASSISERRFVGLLVKYVSRNISELFHSHNPRETFGDHGI